VWGIVVNIFEGPVDASNLTILGFQQDDFQVFWDYSFGNSEPGDFFDEAD